MILFVTRLFLRGDEIMDLGFFSLMEEHDICNKDGTTSGLFVQILGKTEKQKTLPPVTMMLWAMPTHPWLCPLKRSMLLVRIVCHKSSNFFINNDTMISLSASTNESKYVRESIKHPTFLEDFQCFLYFVVKREASLGLHTLRNTACMVDMLDKGNHYDLHESARHKPVE